MASETHAPIFECTLCGACCQGYGGTYLGKSDVDAIAAYLGISPESFLTTYCVGEGESRMLAQCKDGYCVFYDKKCGIHPVKPRMCRAWPHLKSVLVDYNNWSAMAGVCPGIRADAPRVQVVAEIAAFHRIPGIPAEK